MVKQRYLILIRKFVCLMLADIFSLTVATLFSCFAVNGSLTELQKYWLSIALVFGSTLILFVVGGLYKMPIHGAGFEEMLRIAMTTFGALLLNVPINMLRRNGIPARGVLVLFLVFFNLVMISRFSLRALQAFRYRFVQNGERTRVMIVGAGDAGSMVIREMKNSEKIKMYPVCAIDDDPTKLHTHVCGVPVVGNRNDIERMVEKYNVEQIYVTLPSASGKVVREICATCAATGCRVQILPGMYQMIDGTVSVDKIRDVSINDLLGRDPIRVNEKEIFGYIEGKRILVTGGGGSIGSELCRQIAAHNPSSLIIFDIYENNAYEIEMELRRHYPHLDLRVLIGSVRDEERVANIFAATEPEIVFHAAAHKHVPLMEHSPGEAIKNNVLGTYNVAKAADLYGVDRFVMISTDKAVNPTNVMGATKRICEMIVQSFAKSSKHTDYVAVRFGNVLGSNGSVIPLFKKQIAEGGPVTVTHKDIIRYFMTIPEAVALVLQAGAYATGGEIFVLNMGEPVKILDLAENLIRLSGLRPYEDIDIKFTGLRPGEKLYEELLMAEEGIRSTDNKQIFIGNPICVNEEELWATLDKMRAAANDSKTLIALIKQLVPTYTRK